MEFFDCKIYLNGQSHKELEMFNGNATLLCKIKFYHHSQLWLEKLHRSRLYSRQIDTCKVLDFGVEIIVDIQNSFFYMYFNCGNN